MGGPLSHLENIWEIREINNQSEVNFSINFEILKLTSLSIIKLVPFLLKLYL